MKTSFAALTVLLLVSFTTSVVSATNTSLTDFVWHQDNPAVYAWNISTDSPLVTPDYTVYNLYLTAEGWLTPSDSNAPVWHHWVQICVPADRVMDSDMAVMYIDGGHTKRYDQPPGDIDPLVLKTMCLESHVVSVGLYQIPNERITFSGDPDTSRSEDAIIAWTWTHYVNNTLEPDWLLRMPMTKSAIKAMDAVEEFIQTVPEINNVKRWIVGGASKRGWTAWMVGCMGDPRVEAIIPIVAPIANFLPQMNELFKSYGTYSFALVDYVNTGLMPGFLNSDLFAELLKIIDPLTYTEEMQKTPKYVIVSAGDEFFMPDSAQYYWDQLPGEKHLRVVPNAEHSMAGSVKNVITSAVQYGLTFLNASKRPTYSWNISEDGYTIDFTTDSPSMVTGVHVWVTRPNKRRDFRLVRCTQGPECANPALFEPHKLEVNTSGKYSHTIATPPDSHWVAFMIAVDFDVGNATSPLRVSSDLSIAPRNVFPFPPCADDICNCEWNCNRSLVIQPGPHTN